MTPTLTLARLREVLHYDKDTGIFTWLIAPSRNTTAGAEAGFTLRGHRYVKIDYEQIAAHRLAWFYVTGSWPIGHIDHLNGNKSENWFANLRDCSRSINAQNQRSAHKNNRSGLLGVGTIPCGFTAQILLNGKKVHLGRFKTAALAHEAYLNAKRELHEGCTI